MNTRGPLLHFFAVYLLADTSQLVFDMLLMGVLALLSNTSFLNVVTGHSANVEVPPTVQ